MVKKIRVGVLSAGAWSVSTHIPELIKHDDVELVAVTNLNLAVAKKIQSQFGFIKASDKWDEVLKNDLDAIIVSSPPIAHEEMVIAALRSGAHVLCEKPFALNANSAANMVSAAQASNRSILVGYGWAFTDIFLRAKELISSQVIGKVEFATLGITCGIRDLLEGRVEQPWQQKEMISEKQTYMNPAVAGGGAIGTTLSHSLGLLIHILEDSFEWIAGSTYPEGEKLDFHESVSGKLRGGAVVNMYCTSTFGSAPHVSWTFEAFGPRGDIRVDFPNRKITFHGGAGDSWVEEFSDAGVAYKSYMPTFLLLETARGKKIPSGCESWIAQRVVEATDGILRSIETRSFQSLSLND